MNIFHLDNDPVLAAQALCNKHIVKMPLESTQMLCSVVRIKYPWLAAKYPSLYRITHAKHPCVLWLLESDANVLWLSRHSLALLEEFEHRYGKCHGCINVCSTANALLLQQFKDETTTEPPQCMPLKYKVPNDAVTAYRRYYIGEKLRFAEWPVDRRPIWLDIDYYKQQP